MTKYFLHNYMTQYFLDYFSHKSPQNFLLIDWYRLNLQVTDVLPDEYFMKMSVLNLHSMFFYLTNGKMKEKRKGN